MAYICNRYRLILKRINLTSTKPAAVRHLIFVEFSRFPLSQLKIAHSGPTLKVGTASNLSWILISPVMKIQIKPKVPHISKAAYNRFS